MSETGPKEYDGDGKEKKQTDDNLQHYEFARKTIDSWPTWKRELSNKVIRLATDR